MDIREVLAFNLRRYRQAAKLSQEELAHRASIDRTYISALERCVYAAGIDVVVSLLEDEEAEELDIASEADASRSNGIEFIAHPVADRADSE